MMQVLILSFITLICFIFTDSIYSEINIDEVLKAIDNISITPNDKNLFAEKQERKEKTILLYEKAKSEADTQCPQEKYFNFIHGISYKNLF